MPSAAAIVAHWAPSLVSMGHFATEKDVNSHCFACKNGCRAPDRAHIISLGDGGGNELENLHLLCRPCHLASEYMSTDRYWEWFGSRDAREGAVIFTADSLLDK